MKNETQNLISRPPIVVVMGHIDHGKSKLLDYIRKTNIVEGEAGGITQHIGAYEAEVKGKKITFLDTPGHEAFSKIRRRGARVADIAILVIAADEGIKPQTMEAYEVIKKANLPFVIALNKIDKPEANPEQVKAQLAEKQIFVENYGGNIPVALISAKQGIGVDGLLEIVLLLTEMENLKASLDENASGFVIESNLDPKRGISATLIIQNGTMKKGMHIVSGRAIAPIRIFEDFTGKSIDEATFSSPVKITGFDKLPDAGSEFKTFLTKKEAEENITETKKTPSVDEKTLGVESDIGKNKIIIPVVIKADTSGSAEAMEKEIKKLEDEGILISILIKDIGKISEDDARTASASKNSVILGFNVDIDRSAQDIAEKFGILIHTSDIIYKLSEWLGKEIAERKEKSITEKLIGSAKILKIFGKTKNKQVAGGEVLEGKIILGRLSAKIKRRGEEIGNGKIIELQHNKTAVKEVGSGEQFGIMIDSKTEIASGDTIEIIEKLL